MNHLTNEQVKEQLVRFNELTNKTNFTKLGRLIFDSIKQGDTCTPYYLIRKYLSLNKINGSMYNPDLLAQGQNIFYADIIKFKALNTYLSSLKK